MDVKEFKKNNPEEEQFGETLEIEHRERNMNILLLGYPEALLISFLEQNGNEVFQTEDKIR